jgi:hypothetical protein
MAGLCFLTLERMLLTSSFVKLQCDLDNWHDNYETGDCVLCDGCCDSNIGSNTIPLLLKALLGSTNLDKISNQLIYSMSVKNHTVPLSALIIISTCFVNCTWGIDSCNSWRNSGTSPCSHGDWEKASRVATGSFGKIASLMFVLSELIKFQQRGLLKNCHND